MFDSLEGAAEWLASTWCELLGEPLQNHLAEFTQLAADVDTYYNTFLLHMMLDDHMPNTLIGDQSEPLAVHRYVRYRI